MPCFRLGAFGAEGLTAKRVNGLFSFFAADPQETNALGVDLLGHAARLMQDVPKLTRPGARGTAQGAAAAEPAAP